MSAQEGMNYGAASAYAGPQYPRQPDLIHSMDEVRRMFNGYDTGIRYADEHVGRILDSLASIGVLEQTAIIVSADHGENLGELNIYYDHHTADQLTTRVPLIVRWPGIASPRVDWGFHYQVDFAATVVELLGGTVPANWDGRSFADAFKEGREDGRSCLVLSHGAHTCQRSVRFDDYICIRSYHDGYHCFPDVMLFNLNDDPHEQRDLAKERPQLVEEAGNLLAGWHADMMRSAVYSQDPMWTVLREGGPYHTQIDLHAYFRRLQSTGREECAAKLAARYSQTEGKGESS